MTLEEKLNELRTNAKAALDAAEALITEAKFDEAKLKQDEASKLNAQAKTVKAQIEARKAAEAETAAQKTAELQTENDKLKKDAKAPVRIELEGEPEVEGETAKGAFYLMKYGNIEDGVKSVISDLYGSANTYNEKRQEQMNAFVKYIRFGESRLGAKEMDLITPVAKNILLRPDVLKFEIESGRSVGEIKATLVEGSLDLGGYLVPEDFRNDIIKRLMGVTLVRGRARVVTTVRDAVEWPRLQGGDDQYTSAVRVTWVEENPANASVAETNPTFGMLRIPVHTVMARTDLSRNLLEDSAQNLLGMMSELFSESMAIDEDTQFISGTGGGRPYGVLGDRSGAEVVPVNGVTVANSGAAAALTGDGLVDLSESIADQYKGSAVFAMKRSVRQAIRKFKDGNGNYLWQPSYQQGQPGNLLGYSVVGSESLPAVSANNHPVIFGDWKGYMIVDRVGMTVERITDSTLMGTNKVAVFARRRLGGQVIEPWRFSAQKISA